MVHDGTEVHRRLRRGPSFASASHRRRCAPDPRGELISLTSTSPVRVCGTDRLSGLLYEYRCAA